MMQPWTNYLMTNGNMPYQAQMYQQPNPYMERLNNLQQFQQQLQMPIPAQVQPQGVVAKLVDGFDNITANDVPMNGGAIFAKHDGSELQVRQWNANGTITTTRYLPQIDDLETQTVKLSSNDLESQISAFKDVLGGIQEDVKALNEKLDKISKPIKAKKESVEDE